MADSINLSSATRTNLLALQNTTGLISRTQERLSTGLKVNSAIDDAIAFFQARSLTDRAGDLATLKDSIDQGVSALETAVSGIEAIRDIVEQMKGLALGAKSDASSANRSKAAVQFNDLRTHVRSFQCLVSRGGLLPHDEHDMEIPPVIQGGMGRQRYSTGFRHHFTPSLNNLYVAVSIAGFDTATIKGFG